MSARVRGAEFLVGMEVWASQTADAGVTVSGLQHICRRLGVDLAPVGPASPPDCCAGQNFTGCSVGSGDVPPRSVGPAAGPPLSLTELPGFLVSALAAASILYLGVILARCTRTIRANQATIRDLERLLPICASCKKIRKKDEPPSEPESWVAVDRDISEHTKVRFTHGLCPKCIAHLYPDLDVS